MSTRQRDWEAANHAYLVAQLERVCAAVAGGPQGSEGPAEEIAAGMEDPPALDRLAVAFELSPFEQDLLLLCAGVELDSGFAAACRRVHEGRPGVTFGLALGTLRESHWSALTPAAPLRYWRMIEVGPGDGLVSSPLRIDERVLHYLAGVSDPDERLRPLLRPVASGGEPAPSHRALTERIARLLERGEGSWTPVQLCGEEDAGLLDVAAAACELSGLDLQLLRASDIPLDAAERELVLRLWEREAALMRSALLVLVDDADRTEAVRAAAAFVEGTQAALLVGGLEPLALPGTALPRVDVRKPDSAEQAALWRAALGPLTDSLDGQVDELVNQFDMGRAGIDAASRTVLQTVEEGAGEPGELLWDTCRRQSRSRLDDLAQRIETSAGWDDLVLSRQPLEVLQEIVTHVRHRTLVYDRWGFAAKSSRGLGISALFFGASGTGKTLGAEIMASELRLDLYRIDLSQVVSKYIGETEKNLRRVFDAAETAGAVLLFDEADALFGKRSEVKDSHDRYANIEVSYLLQRMESYRGLAILTTNMRQALDPAFTRRIRFVVQFDFPDQAHRAEIWRRIFPVETPVSDLDPLRLARLNVAGGNIRNIAMGAAFLAADEGRPVMMADVLRAARAEYVKLDRPLTDSEIAGWV